jgi:hypothetical protein
VSMSKGITTVTSPAAVIVNSPKVSLGAGGQPIARVGDSVKVSVPTHGDCSGTITSGSGSNTSA